MQRSFPSCPPSFIDTNGDVAALRHVKVADTPRGTMAYFEHDDPIGVSIERYGQWAGVELAFLQCLVQSGDTVVDVGANIGNHSMAFARWVGSSGSVIAIEPQPQVFELLRSNLSGNGLSWAKPVLAGAGDRAGTMYVRATLGAERINAGAVALTASPTQDSDVSVPVIALDALGLTACQFVKIDAEGMDSAVIQGMAGLLATQRPLLYVECNEVADGYRTLAALTPHGYCAYLVATSAFDPQNLRQETDNFFGFACESALLCVPQEHRLAAAPTLQQLCAHIAGVSIEPVQADGRFAQLHLAVPRYGDASPHERDLSHWRQSAERTNVQNEALRQQIERLGFRNRSLLMQVEALVAETAAMAGRPIAASGLQGADRHAARSPARRWASRWSAALVRDPLRRLRFSYRQLRLRLETQGEGRTR